MVEQQNYLIDVYVVGYILNKLHILLVALFTYSIISMWGKKGLAIN